MQRRDFIKLSAAGVLATAFGGLGISLARAESYALAMPLQEAKLTTSICCYCAVGCGLLVYTDKKSGRSINIEGNPDHPINEGTLCPKGSSIWQTTEQSPRITDVLYRAPGSDKWEKKDWAWALPRIAKKIWETREATLELKNEQGLTVNRTGGITSIGSAAIDNEEGWLYQVMLRALGIVYVDSHARI